MHFGIEPSQIIQTMGFLGVAAVIFAESGLLIGFFLPGDSLLFASGLLTHSGAIDLNIHVFVAILLIAAILGDSVGYTFGRHVGPRIFKKENSMFFSKEYVTKAQQFYEKYGALTITLARFVPVIRTFAPIVAGVGNMQYSKFLLFNILGAALWAGGITYLGYYSGAYLESIGVDIDKFVLPVVLIVTLLTLLSPLLHVLRNKESRAIFMAKLGLKKTKN